MLKSDEPQEAEDGGKAAASVMGVVNVLASCEAQRTGES